MVSPDLAHQISSPIRAFTAPNSEFVPISPISPHQSPSSSGHLLSPTMPSPRCLPKRIRKPNQKYVSEGDESWLNKKMSKKVSKKKKGKLTKKAQAIEPVESKSVEGADKEVISHTQSEAEKTIEVGRLMGLTSLEDEQRILARLKALEEEEVEEAI